jgi:electron transfer flavoprotein alpha subunit
VRTLIIATHPQAISHLIGGAQKLGLPIDVFCTSAMASDGLHDLAGAEKIFFADNLPDLPSAQAIALKDFAWPYEHIITASDQNGRDLIAILGALMQRSVVTQVCQILDRNTVVRRSHAGAFMATIQTERGLFSLQTNVFSPAVGMNPVTVQKITLATTAATQRLIRHTAERDHPLSEARRIIGAGKGLGNSEQFDRLLRPLARIMQAEIGGTRSAVEAGMIGHAQQIGQTGQQIAPQLYLAVGISGAAQHIAGIRNSQLIIAINPDPAAPIFNVADYGLLMEAQEALPELATALTDPTI